MFIKLRDKASVAQFMGDSPLDLFNNDMNAAWSALETTYNSLMEILNVNGFKIASLRTTMSPYDKPWDELLAEEMMKPQALDFENFPDAKEYYENTTVAPKTMANIILLVEDTMDQRLLSTQVSNGVGLFLV